MIDSVHVGLQYPVTLTLAHPMVSHSRFDISLLIGIDYYWKVVEDHVVRGDGPILKLGYLLSGPLVVSDHCNEIMSNMHIAIQGDHVNEDQTLEKFWMIESSGTFLAEKDSDHFMDTYLHSSITRQDNGSYVVKFPWKEDHAPLPSNYQVSKRRTRSLVRSLAGTPDLMRTYD